MDRRYDDKCGSEAEIALKEAFSEVLGFKSLGHLRVVPVWGMIEPPGYRYTMTASPRLVLTLEGENENDFPQGEKIERRVLFAGDCCAIHRNAWNRPHHNKPMRFMTVDIRNDFMRFYYADGMSQEAVLDRSLAKRFTVFRNRSPQLLTQRLFESLELALMGSDRNCQQQLCELLWQQMWEEFQDHSGSQSDATWLQLRDFIDEHAHEDLDRNTVAKQLQVHPNHVSRLFRVHSEDTFISYLTAQRLLRADNLLRDTDLSVQCIADRCGFSSVEYFTAVFKKSRQRSPAKYRKILRRF